MANPQCQIKKTPHYYKLLDILGSEAEVDRLYIANGYKNPSTELAKKRARQIYDPDKENIETRFKTILENRGSRLSRLNTKINSVKQSIRSEDISQKQKSSLKKELINLEQNRKELKEEVDFINRVDNIESTITELYEKDKNRIDELLSKEDISPADISEAVRTISHWSTITDPQNTPLFTKEELVNPSEEIQSVIEYLGTYRTFFTNKFNDVLAKADLIFEQQRDDAFKDNLTDEIKEYFKEQTLSKTGGQGMSWILSHLLSISEAEDTTYQTVIQLFKLATSKANQEIDDLSDVINEELKDVTTEQEELMRQNASNTDTRKTGSIVDIFTYEYNTKQFDAIYSFNKKIDSINSNSDLDADERKEAVKAAAEKLVGQLKKDAEVVNPLYLLDYNKYKEEFDSLPNKVKEQFLNENNRKAHRQEILKHLGGDKRILNRYIRQIEEQMDEYVENYQLYKESLEGRDLTEQEYSELLFQYYLENSPMKFALDWHNNSISAFAVKGEIFNSDKLVMIARRYDSEGNNTGYYDKNFERIMSNEQLRKIYWFTRETMERLYQMAPRDVTKGMNMLSIPFTEKTLLEAFKNGKTIDGLKGLYDKVKLSVAAKRHKDLPTVERQRTQLELVNPFEHVRNRIQRDKIKYKSENAGKEMPRSEINERRIQYLDEINSQNNVGFKKILQGYANAMVTYKHKAAIEDSISMIHLIANQVINNSINDVNSENPTDAEQNRKEAKKLQNSLDALNNSVLSLYGYQTKKLSSDKKSKISAVKEEDKDRKKDLEQQIENLNKQFENGEINDIQYIESKETLLDELDAISYNVDYISILDGLNQYVRLKGIGWNVFSGVANIGFGVVANILLGSDGRYFSMKDLMFGYRVAMEGSGKAITMGYGATPNAKKARSAMDRLDLMKKTKHEIIEKKSKKVNSSKLQTISPWNFMERGEYFNQTPLAVALLRATKVTYNGEETNLWELMDENGKLPEDVSNEIKDSLNQFKAKFDRTVARAHGNYDPESPLSWGNTIGGRLLKTFRTWMPQAYYTRFGVERASAATGTVEKGRWKSWTSIYKDGIGEKTTMQTFGFISKQLIKKLWGGKTDFDYYYHIDNPSQTITEEDYNNLSVDEKVNFERALSKVDAANMRANLTELYFIGASIISFTLLTALIKDVFGDDDDEMKYGARFLLNIIGRVQTDLFMWISPMEMERLIKNPVPLTSLIVDLSELSSASIDVLTGAKPRKIKYGSYAGEDRIYRQLEDVFPALNAVGTFRSLGKSTYKNDDGYWYKIFKGGDSED